MYSCITKIKAICSYKEQLQNPIKNFLAPTIDQEMLIISEPKILCLVVKPKSEVPKSKVPKSRPKGLGMTQ